MRIRRLAISGVMGLVAVVAMAYLVSSFVNLLVDPGSVLANQAPNGTYHRKSMGHSDWIWNWDYRSNSLSRNNVDWGMRFIFGGNGEIDLVQRRLNGSGTNPRIHPSLPIFGGAKKANIHDGPEQTGSNWDSNWGIKNNRNCSWNYAHMRFYAQTGEDRNYNPTYGYYVVASLHRDNEGWGCTNMYESFESDEDWWVDRIRDNLGSSTDYDWSVDDNDFNWSNGVTGTVEIPYDTHLYQSDGWGPVVTIPADG